MNQKINALASPPKLEGCPKGGGVCQAAWQQLHTPPALRATSPNLGEELVHSTLLSSNSRDLNSSRLCRLLVKKLAEFVIHKENFSNFVVRKHSGVFLIIFLHYKITKNIASFLIFNQLIFVELT